MNKRPAEYPSMGFWKRNLDKIGASGAIFAALCCLGFPALLSLLSAVGLGFMVNNTVLLPLLSVFLAVALLGLYLGTLHHHKPWALVLGTASAAALLSVILNFAPNRLLAYAGIACLVAASFLNIRLQKAASRSPRVT